MKNAQSQQMESKAPAASSDAEVGSDSSSVNNTPSSSGTVPSLPPSNQTAATAPDPFNPAALRLPLDFAAAAGVKKALLTVPVRKPAREWWIQVHPDPAYYIETAVVELKEDKEVYLVDRALWSEMSSEATFGTRAIFTAVNTLGVVFLWPIRLPGIDGKNDEWSRSALEAASMARGKWVRIFANMPLGAYDVLTSENQKPPIFPQLSLRDLLKIGFKDKLITTLDHPVIQKLRGIL